MSDSNGGLQPIGGLAPMGSLAPIGGSGAGAPPPNQGPAQGTPGAAHNGALNPPPPGAGAGPMLRPPTPASPPTSPASSVAPSFSTSVYVPPRAADAEVWEEPGKLPMGKIFAGLGGMVLVGLLIGAYFAFRTPPPASVPTGYTHFVSADKMWGFDAPQGWSQTTSGATSGDSHSYGMNGTVCQSGSAKIDISLSTVAGLVTSQLLFGSDITPSAMTGSHSKDIQAATKKPFSKTLRDYKETKITDNLPSKMGQETIKGFSMNGMSIPDIKTEPDVQMAEFTASGNSWGLGGPVHGYRATLGGEKLIAYVVCQCSEKDWPRIQPEFRRMLDSVYETSHAQKTLSDQPNVGAPNLMAPIGGM